MTRVSAETDADADTSLPAPRQPGLSRGLAAALACSTAVFAADLLAPLGFAVAALHAVAVTLTVTQRGRHNPVVAAATAIVFTVLGFTFSAPSDVSTWVVLVNRGISLVAIVTVAGLVHTHRRSLDEKANPFASLFDHAPDAIMVVGPDGIIRRANTQASVLFGYPSEALAGMPVDALLPENLRDGHAAHRASYHAHPSDRMMVARALVGARRDGVAVPLEINLAPIDWDGPAAVATIRDVAAVRQQQRDLERSNRDLDEFAYIASHDLKSPLRDVDNLAGWIVEDVGDGLPEASARHLRTLQSRVRRMEALLDDLLAYSRAGRARATAETFSPVEVLSSEVTLLNPDGAFNIEVPDQIEPIHGQRAALGVVFRNLISNAMKHHDRPDGRIAITAEPKGDRLLFRVEDDGPGIAKEHQQRVFHMFTTLKPRDEMEGTGMGLALVKRLVEFHGGEVTLVSKPGQGCVFTFTWPKLWSDMAGEPDDPSQQRAG